jgi:hypothetical protein
MSEQQQPEQYQIPSKEAIEYGRRVIQKEVDRYKKFTEVAREKGDIGIAERHDIRWRAVCQLLGDGGCVIAPFDERWLDDTFRNTVQSAYNVIAEREAKLPVDSE